MKRDEKTTDYLGLPVFKRLYGFGDALTLRVKMATAFLGNVDRRSLSAALPIHPLVALHPLTPLLLIHSDFYHCEDNADPDGNIHQYREVLLAVFLRTAAGMFGPMFPLITFVDNPIALAAGREFHGFPKVPAEIELDETHAGVRYVSFPRGVRSTTDILSSRWECRPGFGAAAFDATRRAFVAAAVAMGFEVGDADPVELMSRTSMGEVWNLRQSADLANPRRAAFSQLTRFRPRIGESGDFLLLDRFEVSFPDEPAWSLGTRFFQSGGPRPLLAFRWRATLTVTGGEVIDAW